MKKSRVPASTGLRWRRGILLLLVCLAPLLSVRGRSDEAPKDKSVQRGHDRFERSCAMCHGAAATGGVGPNLIQSSLVRHDEGGDQIGPVVRNGRSERGMPAFPTLTAGDISDLAAFLQELIVTASVVSSNGLAGDDSPQKSFDRERGKGQAVFLWSRRLFPLSFPGRGSLRSRPQVFPNRAGRAFPLPFRPNRNGNCIVSLGREVGRQAPSSGCILCGDRGCEGIVSVLAACAGQGRCEEPVGCSSGFAGQIYGRGHS